MRSKLPNLYSTHLFPDNEQLSNRAIANLLGEKGIQVSENTIQAARVENGGQSGRVVFRRFYARQLLADFSPAKKIENIYRFVSAIINCRRRTTWGNYGIRSLLSDTGEIINESPRLVQSVISALRMQVIFSTTDSDSKKLFENQLREFITDLWNQPPSMHLSNGVEQIEGIAIYAGYSPEQFYPSIYSHQKTGPSHLSKFLPYEAVFFLNNFWENPSQFDLGLLKVTSGQDHEREGRQMKAYARSLTESLGFTLSDEDCFAYLKIILGFNF